MSVDDIEVQSVHFSQFLGEFNERLHQSFSELNEHHDRLSPVWQDVMRQDYESRWQPLKETMEAYLNSIGPDHIATLKRGNQAFGGYLHGNQR